MKPLRPHAVLLLLAMLAPGSGPAQENQVAELTAALFSDTPLIRDLRTLTDEIGGRITGSAANFRAVEWAHQRFVDAGLHANIERFEVARLWLPISASVTIDGAGARFSPRVVTAPFSTATPKGGLSAPLLYAGYGAEEDLQRLGDAVAGAVLLVETRELHDEDGLLHGLFKEYSGALVTEVLAFESGAVGVVYMSTRAKGLLYRHKAAVGLVNAQPLLTMEREGAQRAARLLQRGIKLTIHIDIDVDDGGPYESANVVAELPGAERPEEIVVLGAHLDSWDLGTGALDNGANVALVIDVARQMRRLGLKPRRTLRFVLFNGEEQGHLGSYAYVRHHEQALDNHVMAIAIDLGTGAIRSFFTNGRPAMETVINRLLQPVAGVGPWQMTNALATGTDTFDFMLQGVATVVPLQDAANYPSNYHAESDTFDKVDQAQLRLNAAILAVLAYGFAQTEVSWRRHDREGVATLVESLDLPDLRKRYPPWREWLAGTRGRRVE